MHTYRKGGRRRQGAVVVEREAAHAPAPSFEAVLLAENYHRTTNDLAVALASLDYAARTTTGHAREVLAQSRERIAGAARLQRLLIPPLKGGIADAADVVEEVCGILATTRLLTKCASLALHIAPVVLDAYACWFVAVVTAELVGNCGKHAFGRGGGHVDVTLADGPAGLVLRVADDGRGGGAATGAGHGTVIVDALAAHFGAVVRRPAAATGTVVEVEMPAGSLGRTYERMRRCGGTVAGSA